MSHSRASSQKTTNTLNTNPSKRNNRPNKGLPLPMKRWIRRRFGKKSNQKQNHSAITPQKVFWAGSSVATLAVLAIVPGKGVSQSIANSTCQQVVKSGAEISRSQLSSLLSIPEGASEEAVRQAINEPYCLLPVPDAKHQQKAEPHKVTTREAYPLAFDPQAWVVVNYNSGTYVDYDFVFKR
jgi:hypothetical protein